MILRPFIYGEANLFHVDLELGPILSDIFLDMGLFLSYIRFIAKFSEI
jgi:hypothetical protein